MSSVETADLITLLRRSGRRVTPERKLLLRIIGQHAHLDATEIYRIAKRERPQIGLATVYRTLTLLKELDLVREIDLGENHGHYELLAEDHVHLVCSICGTVTDVPVPASLHAAAESERFTVRASNLELFGVCSACARKQGDKRRGPA
jgi:Fur family transcriptional regulator, ferric uptake regulator